MTHRSVSGVEFPWVLTPLLVPWFRPDVDRHRPGQRCETSDEGTDRVLMPVAPPRRSLVLNASGEPLCVVTLHRAVTLVLTGKATIVETDGRVLRSATMSVPVPLVLCLNRYVRVPRRRTVPPTRRTVLQRDGQRCAYCTGPADTVDHVVPRSRGGRHEWSNVVAACVRCNHRKADHTLAELGWELAFVPRAPRGTAALLAAHSPDPAWESYLVA